MGVVSTGIHPYGNNGNKAIGERPRCKYCDSEHIVKNGRKRELQQYLCRDCNHQFLENGKFPDMQTHSKIIATAIDLYFEGLSLRKTSRQLKKIFGVHVAFRNILYWIEKYSELVGEFVKNVEPTKLSGKWQVDETLLRVKPQTPMSPDERMKKKRRKGEDYWFWEAIDEETRYLLITHFSKSREKKDAVNFFKKYPWMRHYKPEVIRTDGLQSYRRAINKVFYTRYSVGRTRHHRSPGIRARWGNNNTGERVHGTLKDRTKPMRGLETPETAVLKGWPIHYNFLRPHESLGGLTPAQASGINLPFEDGWGDLIHWATVFQAKKNGDSVDYVEIEIVACN